MVDLGVYNFVKNALAAGKSKEAIAADLARGASLSEKEIEKVFAAVAAQRPPMPGVPRNSLGIDKNASVSPVKRTSKSYAVLLVIALCFAAIGGIAYLLGPQLLSVNAMLQSAHQLYQNSIEGIQTH